MFRKAVACCLIAALTAANAPARDIAVYREGDRVDPRDVAGILGAARDARPVGLTRSIRMLNQPGAADSAEPAGQAAASAEPAEPPKPVQAARPGQASPLAQASQSVRASQPADAAESAQAPAPSALSLPVQFGFDSADILPRARAQLDALAAGIKMLQADRAVLIEGHTDARGSDLYNLQLSRKRAQAVRLYLVEIHGIDENRLKAAGLGEYRLLNESAPHAIENRRVEFRAG